MGWRGYAKREEFWWSRGQKAALQKLKSNETFRILKLYAELATSTTTAAPRLRARARSPRGRSAADSRRARDVSFDGNFFVEGGGEAKLKK